MGNNTLRRPIFHAAFGLALTSMATLSQAAEFRASNGAVLRAPDIDQLTCTDRGTLLLEYSLSDYRGVEELAEGHPDRAIYEYENQLAQVYYMQCQAGSSHYQNAAPAFSSGFK